MEIKEINKLAKIRIVEKEDRALVIETLDTSLSEYQEKPVYRIMACLSNTIIVKSDFCNLLTAYTIIDRDLFKHLWNLRKIITAEELMRKYSESEIFVGSINDDVEIVRCAGGIDGR